MMGEKELVMLRALNRIAIVLMVLTGLACVAALVISVLK